MKLLSNPWPVVIASFLLTGGGVRADQPNPPMSQEAMGEIQRLLEPPAAFAARKAGPEISVQPAAISSSKLQPSISLQSADGLQPSMSFSHSAEEWRRIFPRAPRR